MARPRGIKALLISPDRCRTGQGGPLCNGRSQSPIYSAARISTLLRVLAVGSSRPLSQIVFDETGKGHPYLSELPDCWFSFSSSRIGFLAAWSSTHAIGVDLDDQTRKLDAAEIAHEYFSEAEAKAVVSVDGTACIHTFVQLWSLKEAALKSIGEGLPFGLDAFEFELTPAFRIVGAPLEYGGPKQFAAHVIEGFEARAALLIRDTT